MLKIFNDLKAFFEENYKRIHVREYAKLLKISPPTASTKLETYYQNGLLKKETDKRYNLYFGNKESETFKDLQQIYWKIKLESLLDHLEEQTVNPIIILFGSVAKGENKEDSDIDIAVFTPTKKEIQLEKFEKIIKKNIQLFTFSTLDKVPQKLKNNILNGKLLRGTW